MTIVAIVATVAPLTIVGAPAPAHATGPWSAAGTMATPRDSHTATLLPNGEVLVTGGRTIVGLGFSGLPNTDLYDPGTNSWSAGPDMQQGRYDHTATLLPSGKVLIVGGGVTGFVDPYMTELYNPATNTIAAGADTLNHHIDHVAVLLGNGKVLVAGGFWNNNETFTSELYDPVTNKWSAAGSLKYGRDHSAAALLPNGKVLIIGGATAGDPSLHDGSPTKTAELYDPVTNKWSLAASMAVPRLRPTATLLTNGKVLVTGGGDASAELYNPAANTWSAAHSMLHPRFDDTATLLGDGRVLAAGGGTVCGGVLCGVQSTEIYDPTANTWTSAGNLLEGRALHTATLIAGGKVLVAGGQDVYFLDSAERYTPSSGGGTTKVEDSGVSVQYSGWKGVVAAGANGGSYRSNNLANATASFAFTGTAVNWITRVGPDQGQASVTIDGTPKGTFDLYAPSAGGTTKVFSGLPASAHSILIKVLGTKNAASTGTNVAVDAFVVSSVTTQDSAVKVTLGTWAGTSNASASGGSYRSASNAGATSVFKFTGTGIDWISGKGPAYGQAQVLIDGVSKGTFDEYASTTQWQKTQAFTGLASGSHTITVKALGTKNASSTGTKVLVDAFVVHT